MTDTEPIEGDQLPLAGIRVLEVASWVMAPSAGAILAAFGADVIKVEPAGSADPARAATVEVDGHTVEPGFEIANGGKRAITLDLAAAAGQEVLHRLIERADVFLTNIRSDALRRADLEPSILQARYPELIVAHATGYGPTGPDAERPAFDELGYWARGGISHTLAPEGEPPVQLVGAMGDFPSGVAIVAGITTALFRRERDGGGAIIDVSLYGAGLWTNGWELQTTLLGRAPRQAMPREARPNPLYNTYRCADGRWVQFAMFQAGRYWAPLWTALGRPDLIADPRFVDFDAILTHAEAATTLLDTAIGAVALDDLAPRLDAADLPWSPVLSLEEIRSDEQARLNGLIRSKPHRSGIQIDTVAPPFQFRGQPARLAAAPEVGQDRESLLLELGYDWDEIAVLADRGAF